MDTPLNKEFFITLEGIEGVGKSTAIRFLEAYLQKKNYAVLVTREPGGTEIAEAIRKVLLAHHEEAMTPTTELLLMFASRAQHVAHVIQPALTQGKIVLCDRFTDASFAYQGAGRQLDKRFIQDLVTWVHGDLEPDLTILLDAPAKLSAQRAKHRGIEADRIEVEKIHFFEQVRQCYLDRAEEEAHRFSVINAAQSLSQVRQKLMDVVDAALEKVAV